MIPSGREAHKMNSSRRGFLGGAIGAGLMPAFAAHRAADKVVAVLPRVATRAN